MKIYITRHGQTDWNKHHIIQGRTDIELNETGRKQAHITKDTLSDIPLDCIFVSPLKRALETAQIINECHHVSIYKDDRIIERGFGILEGAAIDQIDFTNFWDIEHENDFPNCERTSAFYQRIYAFIDELKACPYQNVLVVAHGGVSLPFYVYFNGYPKCKDMRKYMLNNCEVANYEM